MNSYSVAERINSDVNASVKYKTDLGQYGVPEFWTMAGKFGAAASFFRPMQVVLNNAGTYAYVVDLGFSDGVVLKCTVDQATGGFVGSCINMNVAGLIS